MQNCATSRERPFRHNSSASSTEIGSETGLALRSECRYFLLKLLVPEAMFELRLSASRAPVLGTRVCVRNAVARRLALAARMRAGFRGGHTSSQTPMSLRRVSLGKRAGLRHEGMA